MKFLPLHIPSYKILISFLKEPPHQRKLLAQITNAY